MEGNSQVATGPNKLTDSPVEGGATSSAHPNAGLASGTTPTSGAPGALRHAPPRGAVRRSVGEPHPAAATHPPYIVIDVGTPAFAGETTEAPTVDSPALPAPEPQVASQEIGDPRDLAAPQAEITAPEPETATAQPPAPAAAPAEAAEAPPTPEEAAELPSPPLPQPQVVESAPLEAELPLAEVPTTTLPEIEAVILDPRPVSDPIRLPAPQAEAVVTEARAVAMQPTATVAEPRPITTPQATAAVTESRDLQPPNVSAAVTQPVELTAPNATASVAAPRPLENPGVRAQVSGVELNALSAGCGIRQHASAARCHRHRWHPSRGGHRA